jgi:APA family basic amino acid/polyamine antiporter
MRSESKLTTWSGVGIVAANMIGAGVFLSAGFMAQEMGPGPILAAWVVGAGLALAGARTYAELARLVPRSGGEYRYLSELVHPSLGFLAGWASLLVGFSAPIALDALAAGAFARTVFPSLPPQWTGAAFVVVLTALHAVGQRTSVRAQNALVLLKAALLVGFVAVGLGLGQTAWPGWAPPAASPAPFARSLFFVAFAFSGWNAVAYAAEEFREPERTVPRAMVLGCLIVAALYLVVNFIFVANLTPAESAVVFDYDTKQVTLAHALVSRLVGPRLGAIMSLFTVAILLSAMSAMLYVGPRVYAAMARDGYLPRALAGREGRPPAGSVILQGAIAIVILFTHELQTILGNVGAILTFFGGLAALGLFRAALRRDGAARPRLAGLCAAGLYAASAAALIAFDVWRHADSIAWIGVVIAVGLGAYAIAASGRRAAPVDPSPGVLAARAPFGEVCRRRTGGGKRAVFLAASLLAQGALIAAVVHMQALAARPAGAQVLVPVVFKRPSLPAAPPPPGPPARPAPHPKPKVTRAPKPIATPKALPEQLPPPDPSPPEDEASDEEGTGEEGGVPGGVPGGVVGGVVGGVPGGGVGGTSEPIAARPADLAMVRARIARTLTYPPRARRMGWEGRVALAFVLLAEGSVRDLRVAQTSGYSLLDDAAMAAVERASPFPPPGVCRSRSPSSCVEAGGRAAPGSAPRGRRPHQCWHSAAFSARQGPT